MLSHTKAIFSHKLFAPFLNTLFHSKSFYGCYKIKESPFGLSCCRYYDHKNKQKAMLMPQNLTKTYKKKPLYIYINMYKTGTTGAL